jgi:hypothetical protein
MIGHALATLLAFIGAAVANLALASPGNTLV